MVGNGTKRDSKKLLFFAEIDRLICRTWMETSFPREETQILISKSNRQFIRGHLI